MASLSPSPTLAYARLPAVTSLDMAPGQPPLSLPRGNRGCCVILGTSQTLLLGNVDINMAVAYG